MGNSCEFKNCIIFDEAQIPHFSYVGDSILGYRAHLGAGVILSNVKLDHAEISVLATDGMVATGLKKFGAIIGDRSGDRLQRGAQSRIGHRARLHHLSGDEFPRRVASEQHRESAADDPGDEPAPMDGVT